MPEETPRKDPAADVPRIPLLVVLAQRADEERKRQEDADKYRFVPARSDPAPLPSEDTPPPAQDDPQE